MADWSQRWGSKEKETLMRRESREMELWKSRVRQVFLEFEKATELLDDSLQQLEITFHDYSTEISFEKYQQLLERGQTPQANAFSISFFHNKEDRRARFMFRYFRNKAKFRPNQKVIPLELNHYDEEAKSYTRLSDLGWAKAIRIRELYFNPDGEFVVRCYNLQTGQEIDKKGGTIAEAVQWFFDDILKHHFGLSE